LPATCAREWNRSSAPISRTSTVQAQKSGIQRKAAEGEHGDVDGGSAEHDVSQPGEPAEQEADAVADGAAENLHGGGKKGDHAPAGKQAAPVIGAKLSGRKIFRAGKDPLKSSTKNALGEGPEVGGMRVGGAQQARVTKPPQHHVFPQNAKDKAWFAARGVDVDAYCVDIAQSDHELLHDVNDWNRQVMLLLTQAESAKARARS
jgi:hypothetical protein